MDLRSMLPPPPWEGSPRPLRTQWDRMAWRRVVDFLQSSQETDPNLDTLAPGIFLSDEFIDLNADEFGAGEDPHQDYKDLRKVLAGYFLVATESAPTYVVDDTYYILFSRILPRAEQWMQEEYRIPGIAKAISTFLAVGVEGSRAEKVIAIDTIISLTHLRSAESMSPLQEFFDIPVDPSYDLLATSIFDLLERLSR